MSDRIEDYIIANRDDYPRGAITDQLLAAGHDRAAIKAAWSRVDQPGKQAPAVWLQRAATAAAIVGGMLVIAFTAITTVPLMMRPDPMLGLELTVGLVFAAVGLAALAAAWKIAHGSPSARSWAGAAAIALLMVGGLTVLGGFSTARQAGIPSWLIDVLPWLILLSGAGLLVLAMRPTADR